MRIARRTSRTEDGHRVRKSLSLCLSAGKIRISTPGMLALAPHNRLSMQGETTMPIKVLELHHHGIRIGKSAEAVEQARQFYTDVLGLESDTGRPTIPGIPGFWLYVGNDQHTAQIHLMGAEGRSPMARRAIEAPNIPHLALACAETQGP